MNSNDTKIKYTIKQILIDWWPSFLLLGLFIRPVILEEVKKVIRCRDFRFGYKLFHCFDCNSFKHVLFTCKSRFCNSCGSKYSKERADAVASKLYSCKHRHLVFTIPEELRIYFRKDRESLNLLFEAVSMTLNTWFKRQSKAEEFTPGFVSTLHTFGRDLKWNPHIHVLLTEGATGNKTVWRPFTHIPYVMLRNKFRTSILVLLSKKNKDKKFKQLVSYFYRHYKDGFYVYAPPNKHTDVRKALDYVLRYLGRPAMAQSRISNYDGKSVTFWYQRHEDNKLMTVTISAIEFIKLLIIHIPDRQFKMVRYYGIYAKKHKNHSKLFKLVSDKLSKFKKKSRKWRPSIINEFNVDPLKCSCGGFFEYIESYFTKNSNIDFLPT